MHTRTCTGGTTFHFNGDLSGDLHISTNEDDEIIIPAKDVIELIARELVLPSMVRELESEGDSFLIENLLKNL